jgi:hypothetical protein
VSAETLAENLERIPGAVRPIVEAALQTVRGVAPEAAEVAYRSHAPRNPSAMWKLVRYTERGVNIVGVGTFRHHSTIWFYRGRELPDPFGLLEGFGKDSRFVTLNAPEDAKRAAVKQLVTRAFELARS